MAESRRERRPSVGAPVSELQGPVGPSFSRPKHRRTFTGFGPAEIKSVEASIPEHLREANTLSMALPTRKTLRVSWFATLKQHWLARSTTAMNFVQGRILRNCLGFQGPLDYRMEQDPAATGFCRSEASVLSISRILDGKSLG
ncbi:hypothetical protein BO86DRAFT_191840 [Aspergillus japonicus CBS 114.51]|uniref:Uncharacterized protein n=1 Tax=Aspergillus japonicus CBS 114.51 TaxID=1448312 RepID=A0A8T8WQV2_ASPJA|nr:hypothetical protein BO86DRAFT_191840 [Aspergillus japonicus CBS 114.51]RAH78228.1 hypothetical protein BO86DRAFT_191840 [Aspergillus japonicus CBS 114.51]